MVAPVKYGLIPSKGKINPGNTQGFKINLQETNYIYKESYTLYISVSNTKHIIDHFLSLSKKYVWVGILFMVDTGVGTKNIFRQIQISYMHHLSHGHFGLQGIANVGNQVLLNPLVVSALKQISKTHRK